MSDGSITKRRHSWPKWISLPLLLLVVLAALIWLQFGTDSGERLAILSALTKNPALLLAIAAAPIVLLAAWKRIYPHFWLIGIALLPVIPSVSIAYKPLAGIVFVVTLVAWFAACFTRFTHSQSRGWSSSPEGLGSGRSILLLSAVLIVSLLSSFMDGLPIIAVVDIAALCLIALDLITIPRTADFRVERVVQKTASLGKKHPVTLHIQNLSGQRTILNQLHNMLRYIWGSPKILVEDDIPQEFVAQPNEFSFSPKPRTQRSLDYSLIPLQRGSFEFRAIHIQLHSLLGLWKRQISFPVTSQINVYPDMKQLGQFELLARTNRLSLMGVRRTRRIGSENDFERLRDYTLDDNYKHIDWRSTARRQKLTVRDFQTSQSQRVIFMVDCGRMMTNQAAGLSLLDHSLNAMLMLSYIALQRGDSVGLICFSDQIHSYVPPRGGSRQMNHLLRASFDRFPELVESRYGEAFLHLSKHCRKRSLVILMTNLIDEINANQVHQYLSTMVGRHLPLGVLLRDHELFQAADTNWRDDEGLYRAAAASEIVCWRHEVIKELQHQGVLSLDVYPEDMTAPLINQYLEIKARHLL